MSAVNDYQDTTNEDENLFKARRIMALFVQNGSKFQILDIPIEMLKLKSRFENLLLTGLRKTARNSCCCVLVPEIRRGSGGL